MVLLLALAGATERSEAQLWSWSAVEAVPTASGETQWLWEEQLGLDAELPGDLQLTSIAAIGGVDDDPQVALYRARLAGGHVAAWQLGRLAHDGVQGRRHLDGLSVRGGPVTGWAGRLWHPESWDVGQTWVLGGEVGPETSARAAKIGWEGRLDEGDPAQRVHAFGALRRPQGSALTALAEAEPGELTGTLGWRAEARGQQPLGAVADGALGVRWEGLPPIGLPSALGDPMTWLAPDGYGALDLDARVVGEAWSLVARATPTWRAGSAGASGRIGVGLALPAGLGLDVATSAATLDERAMAGGVVGLSAGTGLGASVQGGVFRYQPLAGPAATVVEGRTRLELPLGDVITLGGELAAGSDRVLDPWLRGGLALHARSRS